MNIPVTEKDLRRARVPVRYWEVSTGQIPSNLDHLPVLNKYIEGLEDNILNGRGLLMMGDYSTGKTGASVCILKEALNKGFTVLYVRERDLRSFFFDKTPFDGEQTVIQRMQDVDLLIMDDLGSSHAKEYTLDLIETVFRWRSDDMKATVTSTNLNPQAIKEHFGNSLYEVLKANSLGVIFKDINWRTKEQDKISKEMI